MTDRSKEEQKANAKKIQAETKKIQAEARKAEADALSAELKLKKEQIVLDKLIKSEDKIKATDTENQIYRFNGQVDKPSVIKCRQRLTQWSRINPSSEIEIVFSSPGGSITAGFELFDFIQQLRLKGHKITTGSLGMAASMAGILLQAGDNRWIGHQSWILIHRASFGAIGKSFEIEDEVAWIKRIEERIINIFTSR